MFFESKAAKRRRKDAKELEEYNRRQEKYDDKLRDAKQKSKFKSMLARLKFETYTKRLVGVITIVGLIDLQLSYVLAFMDKIQIAETLSGQICTTILGTAFIYMIRAYFDSRAEYGNKVNDNIRKQVESNILSKVQNIISNSGLSEYVNISDLVPDDHSELDEEPPTDESVD